MKHKFSGAFNYNNYYDKSSFKNFLEERGLTQHYKLFSKGYLNDDSEELREMYINSALQGIENLYNL